MRITIRDIKAMKRRGQKIPMVTAYDHTTAVIVEKTDVPIVLVGDSLGNVMLGHDTTLPVTMDEMIHHVKAVVRGTDKAHVVADLPFMSYQVDEAEALRNAGRMLKEGGAHSVKLEGGRRIAETVSGIVDAGIPVMGHIGLTPQSVNQLSGYRVQGKTTKSATMLMDDAAALEAAGTYAIVLELVAAPVAKLITQKVSVPTIGIGAGIHCDGQVQVLHDMLGMLDVRRKHARRYAELGEDMAKAISHYVDDVRLGHFPSDEESFRSEEGIFEEFAQDVFESGTV